MPSSSTPPSDPPVPAQAPAAAASVLDPAALDRLRQLDPEDKRGFVAQVLRTYERSLERHRQALVEARAASDVGRVGEIAHTLKSSSASVGAMLFAQHCATVERLAKAGDADTLGDPLGVLLSEGQRVLTAVRAMLAA